jgi:hypothetical protein
MMANSVVDDKAILRQMAEQFQIASDGQDLIFSVKQFSHGHGPPFKSGDTKSALTTCIVESETPDPPGSSWKNFLRS